MTKSEQINELANALCLAQSEIRNAAKDSENPFFKSHYADLASVREAIREPFQHNGLAYTQLLANDAHGVVVETILLHKSGQFIGSAFSVKPIKDDPQGAGSAITYARRYSLQAIAGIAADDDDGEGAMFRSAGPQPKRQAAPVIETVTESQIKNLYAVAKQNGIIATTIPATLASEYAYLKDATGIHLLHLRATDYSAALRLFPADEVPFDVPTESAEQPQDQTSSVPLLAVLKGIKEIWPETEFGSTTEVIVAVIANVLDPKPGKSGKNGPYKVEIQHHGQIVVIDTFDKSLAALAQMYGAGGEQHEIAFSTTVNGKFTNRKLEGLR